MKNYLIYSSYYTPQVAAYKYTQIHSFVFGIEMCEDEIKYTESNLSENSQCHWIPVCDWYLEVHTTLLCEVVV